MKKFNKNKAYKKVNNKNNKSLKIGTILLSVTILVGTIIYFSFARFESTTSFHLIDGQVTPNIPTLVRVLKKLAANGDETLRYDGVGTLGENGTEDNNLRFISRAPNNYVYFNCSTNNPDEMSGSTCYKFKILGVMNNVEDDNGNKLSLVKIASATNYRYWTFDSSDESVNSGNGINQWGASGTYEGADLMREFNTDYLGNITVGTDDKWYDGKNNQKEASRFNAISSYSQSMIQTVKWHTGAIDEDTSTWSLKNMYAMERGTKTGKICTSGDECNDNVTRTTSWVGKIGLMYPTDYGYATDNIECINTNLYEWSEYNSLNCAYSTWMYDYLGTQPTINPIASSEKSDLIATIVQGGPIYPVVSANSYGIRPTLYLKANVYVVGGDGTNANPYKLAI